ncbi:hypothetical protein ACSBQT_14875 [Brevibacterium sp. H602]|uniref:hypothetical protein n=1 Tax=Brevibacterium sp. H602 TaxID=3444316 RepID=UPI003EBC56F9
MKFLKRALVASVAALALAIGPALSAEAAKISFDVTKLSANSIVVSSDSCRNIVVNMSHKRSGSIDRWKVSSGISSKGKRVSRAYFYDDDESKRTLTDICPDMDGLGKYTIGPSDVWANTADLVGIVDDVDPTKGYFYVRGKTYASLSSKRSGSTVTLTSSTKYYNPEWDEKRNYNPKVKFQVKSGSKWKTLKTVSAKKGKATYKLKSKSKKTYRVTFSQVSWATGATSKSVKR